MAIVGDLIALAIFARSRSNVAFVRDAVGVAVVAAGIADVDDIGHAVAVAVFPIGIQKEILREERIVDSEFIDRAPQKMVELGRGVLVGAHPKRTITDEIGLFEIHEVKCTIDTESNLSFDFVVGHADMVPAGINDFEGAEDRECVLAIAVAECQFIATAAKISRLDQNGIIEN